VLTRTQELIAPINMKFFTEEHAGSVNWVCLGDKNAICDRLASITKIDAAVLSHKQQVGQASVANRMSWAANRVTTKPEDRAYSLMGLFDVNMPMIYGEGGTKAFLRLQEEIIKTSSDQSIFAWRNPEAVEDVGMGIFATSPEAFAESGPYFGYYDWAGGETFTTTNRGLKIPLPIRLIGKDLYVAALNCSSSTGSGTFTGIFLRSSHKPVGQHGASHLDSCERVRCDALVPIQTQQECGTNTTLLVRASGSRKEASIIYPDHILQLRRGPDPAVGWTLYGVMGPTTEAVPLAVNTAYYNPLKIRTTFQLSKAQWRLAAVVVFARPDATKVTFLIGSANEVGDVSIQTIDGYHSPEFRYWEHEYGPDSQSRRDMYNLGRELVVVNTDWLVNFSRKYHLIDFNVRLNPDFVDDDDHDDVELAREEAENGSLLQSRASSSTHWRSRMSRMMMRPDGTPQQAGNASTHRYA